MKDYSSSESFFLPERTAAVAKRTTTPANAKIPEAPSPVSGDWGEVSETVPVTVEPSGVVGATAEGVAVGAVIPGDVGEVSPGTVVPEGDVGPGTVGDVGPGSVTVGAVGLTFAAASRESSAFMKKAPQKSTATAKNNANDFFIKNTS